MLTEDFEYKVNGLCELLEFLGGAADTLYKGGIASIGTDGYIKVGANVAAEIPIGVFKKQVVEDGTHLDVEVEHGKIWLKKKTQHVSTILFTDDSGNSNANYQSKYFKLYNGTDGYYAWLSIGTAGYQELGLTGKSGGDDTGLSQSTAYKVKVAIDGGTITEYTITTPGETVTYTIMMALLDAQTTGATWAISGGDVRCTSDLVSDTSAISITAGSSSDLLTALSSTPDTAVAGTSTGTDPAVSGLTGIEIPILATDDDEQVATRVSALIDAESDFGASVSTATVTITATNRGYTTPTADGDLSTLVTITNTVYSGVIQADVRTIFYAKDDDGVVYTSEKGNATIPAGLCIGISGTEDLLIDFRKKTLS